MVKENNDARKVSEEFVIQVFDKIREVNQELAEDVKGLRNAVIGFGDAFSKRYDGQPRPNEVHDRLDNWGKTFEIRHKASKEKLEHLEGIIAETNIVLKDHCTHSEAGICNIEGAIDKDDSKLDKIITAIGGLKNRVTIMIVAVSLAFTLVTISYLFVRSSIDAVVATKMEKIEKEQQQEINKQLEQIKKALKEHMDKK
jgi:hypothetical protein